DNGDGTAAFAGTPAAAAGGSYPLTITANNGITPNASQSFTLVVNQAPAITSGNSTTFTVGTAGSFSVTTTGFPNAALSKTGSLPSGVTFVDNGNGTATLAGTPAAATGGSYPFTITASNSTVPNATQSFTLTVNQAPAITSVNATTFTTGSAGLFTVTTTGFPSGATMVISESGLLPGGVSFVDNGNGTATLSGSPGATTGGSYPITIGASNGVGTAASQSFTLTVNQAPAITSANTTTFTATVAGSFTVTTTGFPSGATMVISESGSLPGGVTFVDNGNGTATLSGTPSNISAGNYPLTITANNGVGTQASQSFSLVVKPPVDHFTVSAPANATAGTAVNVTVTALDASNAVVSNYQGTVHFTSSDAQAGLPSNYTFVAGDNGVHTFSVTLKTAGSQTVSVSDLITTSATGTSSGVTVGAGADAVLAFVQHPSTAVAGVAITPAVTVQIKDAYGNPTTSTANVTVALGNAGSATLSGTLTQAAAGGVATFNNLSVDKVGTTYNLGASSGVLTSATSNSFTITPAAANHYTVSAPANATAGTAFNVTVTALDQFNNTATGYAGTVHFTSSDSSAVLPANSTLTNGVGTFSATLKTAGAKTLTATDTVTGSITGTSAGITVGAGADAVLAFVQHPSTAVAGVAITPAVTVQIKDAYGNPTTSTANVTVALGNAGSATLSGTLTQAAVGGVATFNNLSVDKVGTTYNLGASSGVLTGATSNSFTITPAAATHYTVTAPGSATAGTAFNVTVTALDQFNNTATGYAGTVHFTSSDSSAVLPANSTLTNGVGTFSAILKTAGAKTITATDTVTGSITGTSSSVTVAPSAATHYSVSAPANATAGTAFNFTVTALDQFNNTATGYSGTVGFTSTDGSAVLPLSSTLSSGVGTFSATLKTAAAKTITATDQVASAITGTSGSITVAPAAATHYSVSAPATATAGVSFTVTVTALDQFNNTASGYTGTVHLTSSDSAATLASDGTLISGKNTFNVTLRTAGNQTVTATDTVSSGITGTSGNVSVDPRSDLVVTVTDSPDPVLAGNQLTYTINVVNNGPSAAASVSLSDTVPVGATFVSFTAPGGWTPSTPAVNGTGTVTATKSTVAPAESASFTLVVKVGSSVANGNVVSNTAAVSTSTVELNTGDNTATATTTVSTFADLAVTVTDSPDPVTAGQNLTYTVTYGNAGPSDAASVTVNDTLPAGTTFVSASSPDGWSATTPAVGSGGTVTFTSQSISPGGSGSFTIVVNVAASTASGAVISNIATIGSAANDTNSGNNSATATTTVNRSADLAITATATPDPVNATQNATYTIDVVNNGPSDASSALVTFPFPANVTFVSATTPPGWTKTSTNNVGDGTGTVTYSASSFAASATSQFVIVLKVNATAPNNSHLNNTITISSSTTDPTSGNNLATPSPLVKSGADLAITGNASTPAVAGSDITYTFTATNNGPLDADSAVVTSVLPVGTTFVSAVTPSGWTLDASSPVAGSNGTVTFTRPLFANGATADFTVVAHINANITSSTALHNVIAAASSTLDIFPLNSSASLDSTVTTRADLAVTMTATPDPVLANGELTYTITVANNGPSDATAASVSLPLSSSTTFMSATGAGWSILNPGVSNTGTVIFSNGTIAQGASATLTVVAKVNSNVANGSTISATAVASGGSDTDPTPGNNSAMKSVEVGTVEPTPLQLAATGTLNRQNGLFELNVKITNTTPHAINGFRLHVDYSAYLGAYPSLRLWNASGLSPSPYIDYPYPVQIDGVVNVKLVFYTSTRTFPAQFNPILTVEKLPTSQVSDTNGAGVQASARKLTDGTVLIEFPSVAGHWYRVRYSSDMTNWFDSPVPLQAGGSKTQWIDSGAPFTSISPADPSVTSRFYIVNEIAAP
ncbi:MAG: putative Ig domain-containing protein, partial [Luteolibacter sp.]